MSSRWFRMYEDVINDPKVMRLPEASRWHWVAVLCASSANEGRVPRLADLAFMLRLREQQAAAIIAELVGAGLLDKDESGFFPHNWNGRQYKSDGSSERVKRFRERQKGVSETLHETQRNVSSAVSETGPEAEQIQNRAEADARTDLQKRLGDFRQAIVQAYAEANSPTLPDTSRAELWVSQGFQEDICLAVIAGIVRKKPNVSLSYFDSPIAEAHTKKAPPRKAIGGPPPIDWDMVLTSYKKFGHWSRDAGNDPTSPNCRAPADVLRKFGIEPVGATP